eukprot:gene2733-2203_t
MPCSTDATFEDAQEEEPPLMAPEAPIFYPTAAEFADPLRYIAQIRSVAELSGICKIVPPPEWTPRFQIDEDKFRFRPRVQVLSQLDAKARVKVDFLNKLAKFWELQGSPLRRVPTVDGNNVDLYTMREIVNELGGFHTVCDKKLWKQVAQQLGFTAHASRFRQNYYKLLFPYDLFVAGEAKIETISSPKKRSWKDSNEEIPEDTGYRRKACTMPFHFHLSEMPGGHPAVRAPQDYVIDASVRRLMKAHRTKPSPNAPKSTSKKKKSRTKQQQRIKMRNSSIASNANNASGTGGSVAQRPRAIPSASRRVASSPSSVTTSAASAMGSTAAVPMPFHWHLNSAEKKKMTQRSTADAGAAVAVSIKQEVANDEDGATILESVVVGEVLVVDPSTLPAEAGARATVHLIKDHATMAICNDHTADSGKPPTNSVAFAAKAAAHVALRDTGTAAAGAAETTPGPTVAAAPAAAMTAAFAGVEEAVAATASTQQTSPAATMIEAATIIKGTTTAIKMELDEDEIAVTTSTAEVAHATAPPPYTQSQLQGTQKNEIVVGTVLVQNAIVNHVAEGSLPQVGRSVRLSKKAAKRADAIDEDLQIAIALSASLQTAGIASTPPTDMDDIRSRVHMASAAIEGTGGDGCMSCSLVGGEGDEGGEGGGCDGTHCVNAGGPSGLLREVVAQGGDAAVPHYHDPYSAYLDELFCERCGRLDNEAEMLICDDCDQGFHMFCLVPPLKKIPRGDWRCPQCVSAKVEKPPAEFGFDMSEKTFSLRTFKNLAEDFKRKYFKDANPSLHKIETEFWRLVTTGVDNGEHVKVFYGADLFTQEHGSGFPVAGERHKNTIAEDLDDAATLEMRDSPWNLNNLPVEPRSLLRYVPGDIAGMKIPWAYAGMCFSSFCWHNEDQWTYSVNYNHVGAPKTWYGIPGRAAEQFEDAIRAAAPELFANQPNLLQHLVTLISPSALQEANVPVVRTDQHAGEFVVTFPRAYHGGYNAGFNLAEAVNFSTGDWLPLGRECQLLYNGMKRRPVFSQEEMVVALARDCAAEDSVRRLGLGILLGALVELRIILGAEKELRRAVKAAGVTDSKRVDFGARDDDERICDVCSTTCYLSAVSCPCKPASLACLHHLDGLCKCPANRATLLYQIKMPELAALIVPIVRHWEKFERWRAAVDVYTNPVPAQPSKHRSWFSEGTLKPPTDVPLPALHDLVALSQTALTEGWDDQQTFHDLQALISSSKYLAAECKTILSIVRPTFRASMKRTEASLPYGGCTFEELQDLIARVASHGCDIGKKAKLDEMLNDAFKLDALAREHAADPYAGLEDLEEMQTRVDRCKVRLPDASTELFVTLQQREWNAKALELQKRSKVTYKEIAALIKERRAFLQPGQKVPELVLEFEAEVKECDAWREEAHLMTRGLPDIQILEMLQAKVKRIETLESQAIETRLQKAQEWNAIAAKIINRAGTVLSATKAKAKEAAAAAEAEAEAEAKAAAEQQQQVVGQQPQDGEDVGAAAASDSSCCDDSSGGGGKAVGSAGNAADGAADAELAKLVDRGKTAHVKLPALRLVENRLQQCANWQLKLVQMFVGKEGKKPMWGRLLKVPDAAHVARVEAIRKVHGAKDEDAKFCLCKTQTSGFMICCEVCEDWFHGSCVGITEKASKKSDAGRFICRNCCRSRRPKPDSVERMIKAAALLNIRMPEVPVLEAYVEAVRGWGKRVEDTVKNAAEVTDLVMLQQLLVEGDLFEMHTMGPAKTQLLDRIGNLSRLAQQGADKLYCTCRRTATADEAMIQCDACEDWFHFNCINLTPEVAATLNSYACGPCSETLPIIDYEAVGAADADSNDDAVYCICRRPAVEGEEMIQCDDCEEWFHYDCVHLTAEVAAAIDHYTCGNCAQKDAVYCVCRRPAGEGETMLQCDGCDDWFHITCIGLSEEEAQQIASYICRGCKTSPTTLSVVAASVTALASAVKAGAKAAEKAEKAEKVQNTSPRTAGVGVEGVVGIDSVWCSGCPFGNKRHARGADRPRAPTCKRCHDEGCAKTEAEAAATAATLMALMKAQFIVDRGSGGGGGGGCSGGSATSTPEAALEDVAPG